MNAIRSSTLRSLQRVDTGGAVAWIASVGGVVYLGLNGGGYDSAVWGGLGVIVWWLVVLVALVALDTMRRPSQLGWLAIGGLGGLALWSAIGMNWSGSEERTLNEVARVSTYLGVLVLGIVALRSAYARQLTGGIATGLVVISSIALLSRVRPTWFPASAGETDLLLPGARNRLSYPLDYWNALGALMALGIPLLLSAATDARARWRRALAAAGLPVLFLTLVLTLSRGALIVLAVAFVTYLAITPQRLGALLSAAVAGAGSAILVAVSLSDHDLRRGLDTAAAHHEGTILLIVVIVVCAAVAAVHLGIGVAGQRALRLRVRVPSLPLRPQLATAAAALVVIALFFALRGPHHLADAWYAFKRTQPIRDADPSRFSSLSSDGRYQMWRASVQALTHHPLTGLGGGTWEFWWARHRVVGVPYVRNAHSLIFETLAETGIPGGALIVAFLGAIVFGAVRRARRIGAHARAPFAAAAAACAGATVSLATDWSWQIAVVPVCMLALAGLALGVDDGAARRSPAPISTAARPVAGIAARLGIVAVAAACAVSVVIPLAMTSEIRQSQAAAARGALSIALQDARSATSLEPYAATAWLQQALVLEADGDLADADTAALRAQHNEPTNWTVPLILARIEAERGAIKAALASARRALKLNPSIRGYFS